MNSGLGPVEFNSEQTVARISLAQAVFSKAAVLRACYWFSRDLSFAIDDSPHSYRVTATLKSIVPTLEQPMQRRLADLIPELLNAFVDAQLRVEIQAETMNMRELILAKAFSEAGVLEDNPPGSFADLVETRNPDTLIQLEPNSDQ